MADKYKLINHELVLKNQSLKEIINSLNSEIQTLKAKQIEINQENIKLLKEIDNYKDIKSKLITYTSNLSYNLAKIFTLIYPPRYSSNNGPAESSSVNENFQQSFLSYTTNRSTLRQSNNATTDNYFPTQLEPTENNEFSRNNTQGFSNSVTEATSLQQQNQQNLISENDEQHNSRILHVSKRKNQKSFTKKSVEVDRQIKSPKAMKSFCSTSLESDSNIINCVDEIIEINSNNSSVSLEEQPLVMSTIVEEDDSSSNHNTIVNNNSYSTRSFKNRHSCIEKENTTLVRNSGVPEISIIQTKLEPVLIDIVNDNMTIMNVPCSTPNQKKRSFSSDLNDDLSISLKNSKVLIKRLKTKNLEQIDIKPNRSEINTKHIKEENINEKPIRKRSRIKESWKFLENSNNERTQNKNDEIDQKMNFERKIRTRSSTQCFTEPSLKMKLRRYKKENV